MNIIEVKNLVFRYGRNLVLNGLTFDIPAGSFVGIAGPNGVGKTTLLNLLCGRLKPDRGTITIEGRHVKSYNFRKLAQKIAVVRQEFVPVFGFTVLQTVLMARIPYLDGLGLAGQADLNAATDALEATGTAQFASRNLAQLSGGERQRVFIARAITQQTPVMLLDEPTSFLDLHHQVAIYDLLKKMQLEKSKTIVAITHDINLASQYCDKILLLCPDGTLHAGTAGEVFSPQRIESVFGVRGFSGMLGRERFFVPLGRYAKDSAPSDSPHTPLDTSPDNHS
ncbi:MAG: ABC transporter ATP-binding protein [Planctomycetota bacterium]